MIKNKTKLVLCCVIWEVFNKWKPKIIKLFLWIVYFSYHFEGLIEQSFSFLNLTKRDLSVCVKMDCSFFIILFCYIIAIAAKDSKSNQASLNIAGVNCLVEF